MKINSSNELTLLNNAPLKPECSAIAGKIVIFIALTVISLITLCSLASIDQITRAQAQVIAAQRTQIVQSQDGGTIAELYVHEGDTVTKGHLLAVLEKERVQATVNDSLAKITALKITIVRLKAEIYGSPLVFPEELKTIPEYIKNQTDLYNRRQQAFHDSISSLNKILLNANQELQISLNLLKSQDVSYAEVLRLKRTVADLEAQIINRKNKFFEDAQVELNKAQEDLVTQQEQLKDRKELLQNTEFHSPVDGVVNNIKFTTIGAVMRPGDVLMEIFPSNSDLLVEAKLNSSQIADVAIGQNATVKLDAWDSSIYGGLSGKVSYISHDILTEETKQGTFNYYRVHIIVDRKEVTSGRAREILIRSGLGGQVEIKGKKRSILSFILKPVIKTLSSSLGEK